jgi:alkanesulfonate monooxygenase SsuD/methylene tetrahydromethanopterin reductase-like flavin-dependent oxidoreductase (luciferase family)
VAALSINPQSGTAPLDVTADASASTDTDVTPIANYTFDFGDGTAVVGPQASPTAQHTYATAGGYTATTDLDEARARLFVGRADEIAERLLALRERYPFDEVVFWARLPGVPLDLAIEHLQRLSEDVLPVVGERAWR